MAESLGVAAAWGVVRDAITAALAVAVCSLGAGPHATPNEARRLSPAGVEEGETQSSPQQDKSPSRVNAVCAASVQTTMPSAVCSLCAQTLAQGAVIAGGSNS